MPEQKQFRWELSDISPGASLVARVAFPPEPKQADIAQGAKVGATSSVLLQARVFASASMYALYPPLWLSSLRGTFTLQCCPCPEQVDAFCLHAF